MEAQNKAATVKKRHRKILHGFFLRKKENLFYFLSQRYIRFISQNHRPNPLYRHSSLLNHILQADSWFCFRFFIFCGVGECLKIFIVVGLLANGMHEGLSSKFSMVSHRTGLWLGNLTSIVTLTRQKIVFVWHLTLNMILEDWQMSIKVKIASCCL